MAGTDPRRAATCGGVARAPRCLIKTSTRGHEIRTCGIRQCSQRTQPATLAARSPRSPWPSRAPRAELASLIDALIDPHEPQLRLPCPPDWPAPTAAVASAPRFARGRKALAVRRRAPGGGGRGVARRAAQGAQPARRRRLARAQEGARTGWRSRWRRPRRERRAPPPPRRDVRADRHRHRHDDDDRLHGAARRRRDRPVAHIPATAAFWTPSPQLEASQPPVASAAAIRPCSRSPSSAGSRTRFRRRRPRRRAPSSRRRARHRRRRRRRARRRGRRRVAADFPV